jgi:hypothetical protein
VGSADLGLGVQKMIVNTKFIGDELVAMTDRDLVSFSAYLQSNII